MLPADTARIVVVPPHGGLRRPGPWGTEAFAPYVLKKRYNPVSHRIHSILEDSLMRARFTLMLFASLLLLVAGMACAQDQKSMEAAPAKEAVLKAADITPKILPEKVFFRGQTATTQLRNTGGVRYADGFLVLATLVDNSGYSTSLREKYQAYLISEVTLEIGGQTLKPGAYGVGFIEGDKFVVMDLGANDLFQVASTNDKEIKHPVPLQVLSTPEAGKYRLYKGRDFVVFHRAK